jgi:glutamyl-tRNA synthetase
MAVRAQRRCPLRAARRGPRPATEIREAASAPHGPGAGSYPGTCLALSDAERARRIAAGERYALRVRADRARLGFNDRLLGKCRAVVDDFVVRRADGVAAYQLAVVVDDAAQGIGAVVRGADLADSTPRQILLARLLGLPVPGYAHVPLVLGADGARLAKRHGAATLHDRREPVSATLALLAHSLGLARGDARVRRATCGGTAGRVRPGAAAVGADRAGLTSREITPDRWTRSPGPTHRRKT